MYLVYDPIKPTSPRLDSETLDIGSSVHQITHRLREVNAGLLKATHLVLGDCIPSLSHTLTSRPERAGSFDRPKARREHFVTLLEFAR